jgi:hypothetical protein
VAGGAAAAAGGGGFCRRRLVRFGEGRGESTERLLPMGQRFRRV